MWSTIKEFAGEVVSVVTGNPAVTATVTVISIAGGIASWVAHKSGVKSGYNKGLEKGALERAKLRAIISKLQQDREALKDDFIEILERIDEINVGENKQASRFMEIVRGYSDFHVFVMACISYARYECVDKNLNSECAEELKYRILGFVQISYPQKLKNDIEKLWSETSTEVLQSKLNRYMGKLPQELYNELGGVSSKIKSVIVKLREVAEHESKIKHQLYLIESA